MIPESRSPSRKPCADGKGVPFFVEVNYMKTSAVKFAAVAREVFAPLYPVVAQRICEETGKNTGICLDIGTGTGLLGIALARITRFHVILLDCNPEMLTFAEENCRESGLEDRLTLLKGDVHSLPLEGGSVNLAVSRGSVFFWDNPSRAFREIYRILAPGGCAWIGGSFGNRELKEKIVAAMKKRDPDWEPQAKERTSPERMDSFRRALEEAGIENALLENDDRGFWIRFTREAIGEATL